MSERKEDRPRTCHTCGQVFVVTANEIKDHAKTCHVQ
jgi:hypothetical protein